MDSGSVSVLEALMIAFGIAVPIVGWVWWAATQIRTVQRDTQRLLYMHDNPGETGFGTEGFREVITANTKALSELSHFVQWGIEQSTGTRPPPYVSE